jgi:thioredoxin reductase
MTANDVLTGRKNVGYNIVVIGGGQVGAETANHLSVQLKNVTLVEMLADIAADEALAPKWHLMRSLEKNKVKILTSTTVKEITPEAVIVSGAVEREIPADTVVIAVGSKPNNSLAEELKAAGYDVKVIGDASSIGIVMDATSQGYEAGRNV